MLINARRIFLYSKNVCMKIACLATMVIIPKISPDLLNKNPSHLRSKTCS